VPYVVRIFGPNAHHSPLRPSTQSPVPLTICTALHVFRGLGEPRRTNGTDGADAVSDTPTTECRHATISDSQPRLRSGLHESRVTRHCACNILTCINDSLQRGSEALWSPQCRSPAGYAHRRVAVEVMSAPRRHRVHSPSQHRRTQPGDLQLPRYSGAQTNSTFPSTMRIQDGNDFHGALSSSRLVEMASARENPAT
jgi:hypothetical protein